MSDDTIARVLAVVIAILAFCLLALAVNTTMWPVRALQGELQVVIVICRMIAHLCCLFFKIHFTKSIIQIQQCCTSDGLAS